MCWKSDSPDYPAAKPVHEKTKEPQPVTVRYCPQCGRRQNQDFAFCPGCGQPKADPPKRDPRKTCSCGTAFGRKDRYCQCCGKTRPTA